MRKIILLLLAVIAFASCHDDTPEEKPGAKFVQTVIMYLPWSGSDMITPFHNNIDGMERAIAGMKGAEGRRFLVFMASGEREASLTEIAYRNGKCERDTLRKYTFAGNEYTTPGGIAGIMSDIRALSETPHYAMIIGCHGMAWIPKGTKLQNKHAIARKNGATEEDEWKRTRFFGHSGDVKYQTDITDLSMAMGMAGVHLDYILFDDCYMANVETAYELRRVTDYIVASPTEIMLYGMPYDKMGKSIVSMDWSAACSEFLTFYKGYKYPYGTISAIRCDELGNMAAVMRDINASHSFDDGMLDRLQAYDGLSTHIFFDFENYVRLLCDGDEAMYSRFTQSLARLVPAKAATAAFYSAYNGTENPITDYSGISVSDPSANKAAATKTKTAWWKATHRE